jgi:hypothetical protein
MRDDPVVRKCQKAKPTDEPPKAPPIKMRYFFSSIFEKY